MDHKGFRRRRHANAGNQPFTDEEIEVLASVLMSRAIHLLAELLADDRREFLLRRI